MITLLSDFGYRDAYVSIMKGTIATIAPHAVTCDLTHAIAPQNILAARFNLKLAYPHFPPGTVHLAVVDPGVGSARRAVAIECRKERTSCFLVGPDNGVLSGVFEDFMVAAIAREAAAVTAVALTNPRYWRSKLTQHTLSYTFHGRDIFAPVAAHLANGVALSALGDRIDPQTLIQADIPPFKVDQHVGQRAWQHSSQKENSCRFREFQAGSTIETVQSTARILGVGCIQHVDGFGNLISNIPEQAVGNTAWKILLETPQEPSLLSSIKTYSDMPVGRVAALVGSHGWIEIARNGGSAAVALEARGGAPVGTLIKVVVEA